MESASDSRQRGHDGQVFTSLPEGADRHRLRQVSEEGLTVLRSQWHCYLSLTNRNFCSESHLSGLILISAADTLDSSR